MSDLARIEARLGQMMDLLRCLTQEVRGLRMETPASESPAYRQAKVTLKRVVRFPGIVEYAKRLGVSRIHLYFVLTGERRSPRIEAWLAKNMRRAS